MSESSNSDHDQFNDAFSINEGEEAMSTGIELNCVDPKYLCDFRDIQGFPN